MNPRSIDKRFILLCVLGFVSAVVACTGIVWLLSAPFLRDAREEHLQRVAEQQASAAAFMLHDIIEKHAETSLHEYLDPKKTQKAIRSQLKLVRLIEAGDEDGAEDHWRRHVTNAGQSVLQRAGRKAVIDLFD